MEVDWAGQTAHIVSTDTGGLLDAYVFVSALPYSGYAYAEAFWDMKEPSWLAAHVNAYNYFGGVMRETDCALDNHANGYLVDLCYFIQQGSLFIITAAITTFA